MKEILAEYRAARANKDAAKHAFEEAYTTFKAIEKKLAEHLVDQGLRNTTDDEGRMYSLRPSFYYRKGKEMTDKILSWLEERGQDPKQYWKPKIETKRLTAFLKDLFDTEGKAPLPDSKTGIPQFFNLDTTPTISVRGWKEDDEGDEE